MSDFCLTRPELEQLTGKIRPTAQKRALDTMGIDARVRPDGTVAVVRATLEPGGARGAAAREALLDLDALEHVA